MKKITFITFTLMFLNSHAFAAAEDEKEVLKETAAKAETIKDMKDFKAAATKIRSENSITDLAEMRASVESYYRDQYGKEYEKKNGGKAYPKLDGLVKELHEDQIAAQYYYISNNPKPLGSKHELNRADDKSTYSAVHAKSHSKWVDLLDENGLYDIFLLEPKEGVIVYSVYKELDFFDRHTKASGFINADSGLGEAFQKAAAASCGTTVESRVDKYGYSYDALALFIATPICDGGSKEGVLVFQVNP